MVGVGNDKRQSFVLSKLLRADSTIHLVDLAGYGCRRYLGSSDDVANVRVSSFAAGIFPTKAYALRSFPNGRSGQLRVAAKLLQWWE
jgi:hypothetical protein